MYISKLPCFAKILFIKSRSGKRNNISYSWKISNSREAWYCLMFQLRVFLEKEVNNICVSPHTCIHTCASTHTGTHPRAYIHTQVHTCKIDGDVQTCQ